MKSQFKKTGHGVSVEFYGFSLSVDSIIYLSISFSRLRSCGGYGTIDGGV